MAINGYIVNTDALAEALGKTRQRVNQLAAEGVLVKIKPGKWDLSENVKRYITYLESGRAKVDVNLETEKLRAEVDYKRNKADITELELRELEGNMHRSEDVESVMTDLVFVIRSMIMALPGRLAADVCKAKTAAEASVIIRKEANHILNELTNYQYDPEVYAKRVREREGWREEARTGAEEWQ